MDRDLRRTATRWLHSSGIVRIVREAHLATLRGEGRLLRRPPTTAPDGRLRILGYTPSYLPDSPGGSEVTLHWMLRRLQEHGHAARVLVHGDAAADHAVDGISVVTSRVRGAVAQQFDWADVVLAQLGTRNRALRLAASRRRPLAFYTQLGNTPRNAMFGAPAVNLFNSAFTLSQYPWISDGIVFHPPVELADYTVERGDAVTLVNLSALKGAHVFWALAERFPERPFLGVRGWGAQVIPDRIPANVTLIERTSDIRSVYARTRVLLVPSIYESYGRVGLEAGCSGIPTIAHPNAGLCEALGDAALWADRDDLAAWVAALGSLDDAAVYTDVSDRARARAEALDPSTEFAAIEAALVRAVEATR
jgi:hypothetical protein